MLRPFPTGSWKILPGRQSWFIHHVPQILIVDLLLSSLCLMERHASKLPSFQQWRASHGLLPWHHACLWPAWELGDTLGHSTLWHWEHLPGEWACAFLLPKQSPGTIAWLQSLACRSSHAVAHTLRSFKEVLKTGFWKTETPGNYHCFLMSSGEDCKDYISFKEFMSSSEYRQSGKRRT